nr:hypothetical protein L203_04877 [Cryptococcus depauperatus CBS 7841]
MARRFALYGLVSTVIAFCVVSSALRSRANFYAAMVSIGKSSGSIMILGNFVLFNVICLGIGLKKLFFGQLRTIEYERLWERLWIFTTESLLAMAIFRDDFSMSFLFMYGVLIFMRCFHWITADRVDYMDQIPPPGPPRLFHVRISSIVSILMVSDFLFIFYSLEKILKEGASAIVIFAAEFLILQASMAGTAARYAIGVIDFRRARGQEDAPPWEAKSMYLFYVDLVVDFLKLSTYLMFFAVILMNYGLPLHILRDVYMTLNSFISRIRDLVRYRRATRDMDSQYPDATEEELERNGDTTCIICREEMITRAQRETNGIPIDESGPNETPKKLVCGHIFHFHCLRSWLERQQKCPTCRRDVLHSRPPPRANDIQNLVPPEILAHMADQPAAPAPAQNAQVAPAATQTPIVQDMRHHFDDFFQPRDVAHDHLPERSSVTDNPQTTRIPTPSMTSNNRETAGQTVQRSIWGGPVTIGKFVPAPLGSVPRMPARPSLSSANHSSHASSSAQRQRFSQLSSDTSRDTQNQALPLASPLASSSPVASGSTTPFHSNPPTVFTHTGTARPNSQNLENDGDNVRRQAAEAALRRLGSNGNSYVKAGGSDSTFPAHEESSSSKKGKQKAEEPTIFIDEWNTPSKVYARLSSPHSTTTSDTHVNVYPTTGLLDLSQSISALAQGIERTPDGARKGLEKRLELLARVDEQIWGLIGELTRLKSKWEMQDGLENTGGLSQPATDLAPSATYDQDEYVES